MAGEKHGANEPAQFVIGLTDLLTKENIRVQVGFEIASETMKKYLSNPADSNIYTSEFFTRKYTDARASFAWADGLAKLNDNSKVEIFFYDVNTGERKRDGDRDSLMYLKIKQRIVAHPTWKTIILSGNIHNMLQPYDTKSKMALLLKNDIDLDISKKLLSVLCYSAVGVTWDYGNNRFNFIKEDNSGSIFAKTVPYENYLLLFPPDKKGPYNGIYFTRKITPARLVRDR
jgi:hypothetical protein